MATPGVHLRAIKASIPVFASAAICGAEHEAGMDQLPRSLYKMYFFTTLTTKLFMTMKQGRDFVSHLAQWLLSSRLMAIKCKIIENRVAVLFIFGRKI